jgi:hypothetical protein
MNLWRSRLTLNLAKIKFGKKWNLQVLWGMENFTLPSVGARFKRLERKLSKGFSQNSLFLLPTFLGWCSQLLLVGFSTCPPCLDFSLNFQTPITFDPKVQKLWNLYSYEAYSKVHVQKKFKKSKIQRDQVTLSKTSLSPIGISKPVGVNDLSIKFI